MTLRGCGRARSGRVARCARRGASSGHVHSYGPCLTLLALIVLFALIVSPTAARFRVLSLGVALPAMSLPAAPSRASLPL